MMETKEIIGMDSAYICAQEAGSGNMQISAGLVVELIDRLRESEDELSILPGKWSEDSSLETWFPYTNDELVSLRDENAKLKAELEAIKKQEATKYSIEFVVNNEKLYFASDSKDFHCQFLEDDHGNEHRAVAAHPLYAKPVYQHSFTVDGHTFYADSEVDILYLERKFGVGGKAKLEVVKDE